MEFSCGRLSSLVTVVSVTASVKFCRSRMDDHYHLVRFGPGGGCEFLWSSTGEAFSEGERPSRVRAAVQCVRELASCEHDHPRALAKLFNLLPGRPLEVRVTRRGIIQGPAKDITPFLRPGESAYNVPGRKGLLAVQMPRSFTTVVAAATA